MKKLFFGLIFLPLVTIHAIGDPARQETKLQEVYDQYALSGEGVIIAMIDRGIDYRHPAFLTEEGTSRAAYLYDMTTGPSNNPYGVGTIYDQTALNASLIDGGVPLSMDFGGHGTATTGIACGNGAGTMLDLDARGVAFNATIISIKFIQDPFPPFGGEPGQDSFFDINLLDEALDFIADKAAELDMPVVTLMNFGSIGGPTDGTSATCRIMDDFVAQGHVLVCGSGDDGGDDSSAAGSIAPGEHVDLTFVHPATAARIELYYNDDARLDVSILTNGNLAGGPYASPAQNNGTDQRNVASEFNYFHRGSAVDFFGATSPRRQILIDFPVPTTITKMIRLTNTSGVTASFQASMNPAAFSGGNGFTSFVREGHAINDYASAFSVITPTDYVVDNTWTDVNGVPRSIIGQGEPGGLWLGSSKGPTNDGRLGVDIAVPGEVLIAPYSPNTFYSRFSANLVQGGENLYGIQTAVSAAAPLLTGVLALMLELRPDLSPEVLLQALHNTARVDSFTGAVPNACWGYGKLDAEAAMAEILDFGNTQDRVPNKIRVSPNPTQSHLQLAADTFESLAELEEICIYEVSGKKIQTYVADDLRGENLDVAFLRPGLYTLTGRDKQGTTYVARFVKQ